MEISKEAFDAAQKEFEEGAREAEMIRLVEHDFLVQAVGLMAQTSFGHVSWKNVLDSFLKETEKAEEIDREKAREVLGDRVEILVESQQRCLAGARERLELFFGISKEEGAENPGA